MQQPIQEKGIEPTSYLCNVCPSGCRLDDYAREGTAPVMHQHHCHRFPSLMTAWVRIA